MSEPMIRRANPGDARAIAEVHVAAWRTTYPGIVDQAYIDSLSVDQRATDWERRPNKPPETAPDVIVAESRAGIVGFASGGAIREPRPGFDGELYAIYLLENAQGAGVGRRLVQTWARLAVDRGFRAAIVRVLAANPACTFYEHLGARFLESTELTIGGNAYAESWYGWTDLVSLADR
jgi:GNAT superfamily N-acetyltransferase